MKLEFLRSLVQGLISADEQIEFRQLPTIKDHHVVLLIMCEQNLLDATGPLNAAVRDALQTIMAESVKALKSTVELKFEAY